MKCKKCGSIVNVDDKTSICGDCFEKNGYTYKGLIPDEFYYSEMDEPEAE